MASVVRYGYPFAETEKPPPPVVLLLLQTDLNVSTSMGLVIHEDLDNPVPSAKKTVVFAPVLEHAYPPPPIFEEKIPTPTMLTRKVIENHAAWEGGDRETIIIKVRLVYLTFYLLNIDVRQLFTHWWTSCWTRPSRSVIRTQSSCKRFFSG
jgi:hypothetical protein